MDIHLLYVICTVLAFIPAIVLHEVAHGWAAYRLGDPTAKQSGRLSLNPLKHIDPFGTVILPLILLAIGGPIFGYAKPVPYNPTFFKNLRLGDLVVGLAGPAANLLQALAMAVLLHVVALFAPSGYAVFSPYAVFVLFGQLYVLINLYLMFFNLLPIPPLDGSSIIACFVPDRYLGAYYRVQQYALPILLIVLLVLPSLTNVDLIGMYLNATAGNLAALLF